MTAAAAVAFALIVAVDWVAVYRQWARAEQVAKPLVMVALAWLAFSMGAAHDEVGRLVLVALGFSLAGDIFLLRESAAAFFGGLVSSSSRTSPTFLPSSLWVSRKGGRWSAS